VHQHGEVGKSGPSRWRSRNRSVSAARPASANWVRVACSSSKLSASRRSSRDRNLLAWRDTAALKTSCWNEPSSSRQRRTGLGRAACGRAVAQVGPTPSCVQVAPPGPVGPGSSATLKLTNHHRRDRPVHHHLHRRRRRSGGQYARAAVRRRLRPQSRPVPSRDCRPSCDHPIRHGQRRVLVLEEPTNSSGQPPRCVLVWVSAHEARAAPAGSHPARTRWCGLAGYSSSRSRAARSMTPTRTRWAVARSLGSKAL